MGSMTPIEVSVSTEPVDLKIGQPVTLRAEVTQDGKPVNDADEVLFEIWPEGADEFEHEKIEGELDSNGVYSIDQTFTTAGKVYVVAHVTARTFHSMPKVVLTITE